MKKILPLFAFLSSFFLFGCNQHQFIFIEPQQDQYATGGFKTENDSLEIRYNFSGENIPVKIKIKNKSEKPVYIDWKKSVVIIDGKKYNYWNENSHIELSSTSYPLFYNIYTDTEGTIEKDERITYIAPRSYIETTRIFLQTTEFELLPENNFRSMRMRSGNGSVKVKRYNFSEEDSPLIFRSLLTLSSKETFTDETLFESTFWVSDILESPSKSLPLQQPNEHGDETDINYPSIISSKTEFGKAAGPITLIGLTTGLLYLASENTAE